jgi:hypothetical protein
MVKILSKFNKFDKTKYEKHCMIDLECLGTGYNAVILSIGAVVFDPYASDLEAAQSNPDCEKTFSLMFERVDLDSCERLGMTIDEDTIKWWSKQNPEAIESAFSEENRKNMEDVLRELYIFSRHCTKFWAKSPQYDCSILEHAAKAANIGVAWQYYQLRDVRTIEELSGLESKSLNAHDALGDAYNQAMIIQKAYKKLGMQRPEWPE